MLRSREAKQPLNHNVKLALWWSLLENMSASVRSGDVMSALLFLLTASNTTVGIVQGVNGVVQMLAALPAGWAADRHRRDTMLRCGAVVGAAAGAVLGYALALRPTVWMLGTSSALLGCYRGIYSAALEAIWADSVAAGRSSLYTKRYALTVLSSSFGPWLSLGLFHFLGNQWHERDCRLVLGSGLLLMAAPLTLMCCFDDEQTLHAQQQRRAQQAQQAQQQDGYEPLPGGPGCSPGDGETGAPAGSAPEAATQRETEVAAEAGLARAGAQQPHEHTPVHAANAPANNDGGGDGRDPPAAAEGPLPAAPATSCGAASPSSSDPLRLADLDGAGASKDGDARPGWFGRLPPGLVVTLLISFSDFIGALASGMTLRFFALFFMQAAGMRPMEVSLIGALSPLGVTAASLACQPLSKRVGRVQISLVTRSLDIALLVCLAYLPTQPASAHTALVAVHLLRMAVANATRPLMRSVLMDCVPRRHRGKVNAVDSVRMFSWSGSAALGGFLIERYGFQATFLITAAIKLLAFLPLFALLAYVPDGVCIPAGARKERMLRQQHWAAEAAAEAAGVERAGEHAAHPGPALPIARQDGELRQPLLAGAHKAHG